MKVCAHINVGPHQNVYHKFDSITAAVAHFRDEVVGNPYVPIQFNDDDGYRPEYSDYGVMDLYPQCDRCDHGATYHDYPLRRYGIGRRGGLVRVSI